MSVGTYNGLPYAAQFSNYKRGIRCDFKSKTILENKFWIVEQEGVRIGTLAKEEEGFVVSAKGKIDFYKSERQLKNKLGKKLLRQVLQIRK